MGRPAPAGLKPPDRRGLDRLRRQRRGDGSAAGDARRPGRTRPRAAGLPRGRYGAFSAPGQAPRLRRVALGPGPPNDDQARRMVGPGEFGKTEAWYFMQRPRRPNPARGQAGDDGGRAGSRDPRRPRPRSRRDGPTVGEAVLMPAGTLHALGPGCCSTRSSRRATRPTGPTTGNGRRRPDGGSTSRSAWRWPGPRDRASRPTRGRRCRGSRSRGDRASRPGAGARRRHATPGTRAGASSTP